MAVKSPLVGVESSAGRIEVVYGLNGWVSVGGAGARRPTQAQARTPLELRRLLAAAADLPAEEADALARRVWAARPADATGPDVHATDGLRRSTGLSGSGVALVFAAVFAAVAVLAAVACSQLRDRDGGPEGPVAAAVRYTKSETSVRRSAAIAISRSGSASRSVSPMGGL